MAPSLARAVDEGGLGEIPSRRHQKDCEANEWETRQGGAVGCVREEERLNGEEGGVDGGRGGGKEGVVHSIDSKVRLCRA